MTSAPKPRNFTALADAWDDPISFDRELANYYRDLEASGLRTPTPDVTMPREYVE